MKQPITILVLFSALTTAARYPHGVIDSRSLLTKRDRLPSTNLPAGWRYFGCYTDQGYPRTFREYIEDGITLSRGAYASFYGTNTGAICVDFCRNAGYQFAGVEYMYECFCASKIQEPGAISTDGGCNMPCDGNNAEACGGSYRLSVYTNDAPIQYPAVPAPSALPSGWEYNGCYTDGENAQATLRNGYFFRSEPPDMNATKCISICSEQGYAYAGTKAQECYCSNEISEPGQITENCIQPCPAHTSEACGGTKKISIYGRRVVLSSSPLATSESSTSDLSTSVSEPTSTASQETSISTADETSSTEVPVSTTEVLSSTMNEASTSMETGISTSLTVEESTSSGMVNSTMSTTVEATVTPTEEPTLTITSTTGLPTPTIPLNLTGSVDLQCVINSLAQCRIL